MSTQPLSRESVTPSLPSISVIVPVCGRRSELRALYQQYKAGVAAVGLPFEFIFVIDGDRTDACKALEAMLQEGEDLTVINLTRSFGEAAALMAGTALEEMAGAEPLARYLPRHDKARAATR